MRKGFTLIELLVVIAIIGVLSALLMSNFIGVRQRARDAQRKSDVRQIQSALELYRADNGSYPSYTSSTLPCGSSSTIDADGILNTTPPSGKTIYMQSIPCDPSTGIGYTYSGGATYTLTACLENGSDGQRDANNLTVCSSANPVSYSYTVTNP